MSTAQQRILAAAITCFAANGFEVGLREIGAEAGCSAALIVRHFGSKEALHQACDADVAAQIKQIKSQSIAGHDANAVMAQLADVQDYAGILGYVVHSLLAGGELARAFVDQMIEDAVEYIAEGERSGMIRPSRDPRARARYLAYSGLGAMLMQVRLEQADTTDLSALVRDVLQRQLMPSLELYTYGFFTGTRIFEEMLAAGYGTEPGTANPSAPPTPPAAEGDP